MEPLSRPATPEKPADPGAKRSAPTGGQPQPSDPIDPSHPLLVAARAAFVAGDYRRAHAALCTVAPGELSPADRALLRRLERGVSLDPVFLAVAVVMLGIWALLFASFAGR